MLMELKGKPASYSFSLASSTVQPIRLGTVILSGPRLMYKLTFVPFSTALSASGDCLKTVPAG